jgi:hypothetical protein
MKFGQAQILYYGLRSVVRSLHAIAYAIIGDTKASDETIAVSLRHLEFVDEGIQKLGERQ